MPLADLLSNDPLIGHSFFLEIDGSVIGNLSSVGGLDMEVDVSTTQQVGPKGKMQMIKFVGNQAKAPDLSLTRNAPNQMDGDKLWEWFNKVRDTGMKHDNRADLRKNGSIVIYDTANTEVARYNFFNAFPSKISTSELGVDKNDPVTETITLACERLERKK